MRWTEGTTGLGVDPGPGPPPSPYSVPPSDRTPYRKGNRTVGRAPTEVFSSGLTGSSTTFKVPTSMFSFPSLDRDDGPESPFTSGTLGVPPRRGGTGQRGCSWDSNELAQRATFGVRGHQRSLSVLGRSGQEQDRSSRLRYPLSLLRRKGLRSPSLDRFLRRLVVSAPRTRVPVVAPRILSPETVRPGCLGDGTRDYPRLPTGDLGSGGGLRGVRGVDGLDQDLIDPCPTPVVLCAPTPVHPPSPPGGYVGRPLSDVGWVCTRPRCRGQSTGGPRVDGSGRPDEPGCEEGLALGTPTVRTPTPRPLTVTKWWFEVSGCTETHRCPYPGGRPGGVRTDPVQTGVKKRTLSRTTKETTSTNERTPAPRTTPRTRTHTDAHVHTCTGTPTQRPSPRTRRRSQLDANPGRTRPFLPPNLSLRAGSGRGHLASRSVCAHQVRFWGRDPGTSRPVYTSRGPEDPVVNGIYPPGPLPPRSTLARSCGNHNPDSSSRGRCGRHPTGTRRSDVE